MLDDPERARRYQSVRAELALLLDGEDDWIATLSTIARALHNGDSDTEAVFNDVDQRELEALCDDLGRRWPNGERRPG